MQFIFSTFSAHCSKDSSGIWAQNPRATSVVQLRRCCIGQCVVAHEPWYLPMLAKWGQRESSQWRWRVPRGVLPLPNKAHASAAFRFVRFLCIVALAVSMQVEIH